MRSSHHVKAWKLSDGLRLLSLGLVLVVWVLFHMCLPQPFRFVDVRSLLLVCECLPLRAESFADLRVVHLGILVRNLLSHLARPHHKCVHRSLHFIVVVFAVGRVSSVLLHGYRWHADGIAATKLRMVTVR